jgi:diguanylate cyclase (GGDEF)-like protein
MPGRGFELAALGPPTTPPAQRLMPGIDKLALVAERRCSCTNGSAGCATPLLPHPASVEMVLMALPGSAVGWWTGVVRTVLPQRGALANARDAVEHDRWRAARRRDALLSAGRMPLGLASPVAGGLLNPPVTAVRPGCAVRRGEQVPDRVVDLVAHEDFASAAQEALLGLHERLGLDLWLVAAVDSNGENVMTSRQLPDLPVSVDAVRVWAQTCCRLVMTGRAPQVAPHVAAVTGVPAPPPNPRWQLAAYIVVPLLAPDGALLGTLCGVSGHGQPDALPAGLPEVERVTRLLSTVLTKELTVRDRARALAEAYLLTERDPLTGLLNRLGWEARLRVEEQRCHRHLRPASVLVFDLDASTPVDPFQPHRLHAQLRAAADLLTQACRSEDTLARPDSGHLAVLAVECDGQRAAQLAERLQEVLHAAGLTPAVAVATRNRDRPLVQAWDQAVHQSQRRHAPARQSTAGHSRDGIDLSRRRR